MFKKDNNRPPISFEHIRLSLDYLLYRFGVNADLSLNKAMKDIFYTPLYITGFISVIKNY
ncbi:hypothetical protein U3516DRAFT_741890 [Neocallimastix sp. 'constans']